MLSLVARFMSTGGVGEVLHVVSEQHIASVFGDGLGFCSAFVEDLAFAPRNPVNEGGFTGLEVAPVDVQGVFRRFFAGGQAADAAVVCGATIDRAMRTSAPAALDGTAAKERGG